MPQGTLLQRAFLEIFWVLLQDLGLGEAGSALRVEHSDPGTNIVPGFQIVFYAHI